MSERFAPVSTISRNGPRPLIITGATMRPIRSIVVGVANSGPESTTSAGGLTGASEVAVAGTSVAGAIEVAVAGSSVAGASSTLHNPESAQAVTTKRFMRMSMGADRPHGNALRPSPGRGRHSGGEAEPVGCPTKLADAGNLARPPVRGDQDE